ncbi:MAG: hypothetical protein GXO10_00960 [Crenarchaeota archaeon]|nr:hypothetical protein [Thermoproteota archaeon]
MSLERQRLVQRHISRLQGSIRKAVVEFLKKEEPQALKFVRVGISPIQLGSLYKLSIKIYHTKPLKLETINELVRRLRRNIQVADWYIYAPHANAIRIETLITIDILQGLITSPGTFRI